MIPRSDDLYQIHYGPPPDEVVDVHPIGSAQPHHVAPYPGDSATEPGPGVQRLLSSSPEGGRHRVWRRAPGGVGRRERSREPEPLPPWKGTRVDVLA
jgi:hypothetical protein